MKLFYINNKNEIFLKKINDIELNNNIRDRFKVYQFLKKQLNNKIDNFYLFYDKDGVLNCIIEFKNLDKNDSFEKIDINDKVFDDYFLYKKACKLAEKYHEKQIYGGFLPYIFHLNKVNGVIDSYFFNIPSDKIFLYKIGAMLHDIVEDTEYKIEDVEKEFGKYISNILLNVTKVDEKHTMEYEDEYYKKVSSDLGSIYVKLADKIINGKQTIKDRSRGHLVGMTKGHQIFKERIYNGICDNDIKDHLDRIMGLIKNLSP